MEKKKTIIIEAQRVFRKKKHGMDFVALELIKELQHIDTYNNYIIAVGPGEDVCLTETSNFRIEVLPSSNYMIWEQILLPRLCKKYKADLLHCTSNTAPVFGNTPLVLTLHDIIFMEGSMGSNASTYQKMGRLYRRWVVPLILRKVREIITVSNFERDNILERYPTLSNKIHAIYNGVGKEFNLSVAESEETFDNLEQGSYWLFLGNTDPKKNMPNTLMGYAGYLQNSTIKRKLMLLDVNAELFDKMLEECDITFIKPYLIIKSYVSHDQLPLCYHTSYGFLYTSLRESFGLPLIEAMACGTAVVGSNTSAIPEVAGDSIVYADPRDPQTIAEAMLALEKDTALHAEMIEKGLEYSKRYSWFFTAEAVLKIYNSVSH